MDALLSDGHSAQLLLPDRESRTEISIPRFVGCQVWPASSVRNTPAAEIAMKIRSGLPGSRTMVCSAMPPAPGCQR